MEDSSVFRKARLRLRDSEGNVLTGGWVVDVTKRQLIADLLGTMELSAGDNFALEVYGARYDLRATAEFRMKSQERTVFNLTEVLVVPATEAVRMAVPFFTCELDLHGMRGEASAVDISLEGIGFLTTARLSRGDVVNIEVNTPEGPIEVIANIRYCIATDPNEFEFRAGGKLKFPSRIDNARWLRLFEAQLAA